MNLVAKMSDRSVIFLKFFKDAVTTPSEGYDHRQMAEVYIGLQAAVHGSGIPFQKLMKIINILHEI
jgi:hypothetical protein